MTWATRQAGAAGINAKRDTWVAPLAPDAVGGEV
jgi:hypothetical protein